MYLTSRWEDLKEEDTEGQKSHCSLPPNPAKYLLRSQLSVENLGLLPLGEVGCLAIGRSRLPKPLPRLLVRLLHSHRDVGDASDNNTEIKSGSPECAKYCEKIREWGFLR